MLDKEKKLTILIVYIKIVIYFHRLLILPLFRKHLLLIPSPA